MAQSARWGEEVEEHDYPKLPRPKVTIEEGKKTVVSYSRNDEGKIEKKTQVFRTETHKELLSEAAVARRSWKKYGEAKGLPPGPSPATTRVGEDVYLELKTAKEQLAEAAPSVVVSEQQSFKCRNCGGAHLTHKCPLPPKQSTEAPAPPPPKHKEGDDAPTVRVSNLSDDIGEWDLRNLFSKFCYVTRVFIAMDRTPGREPRSRGFAYVNFSSREDAQKAVEKFNGFGFKHMILRVELSQRS